MWNTIHEWLNVLPVSEKIIKSALMSVLMIVTIIAKRSILLSAYLHGHPDLSIENKYRSLVSSCNVTMLLILLGLAMIQAAQIQTLALSMLAMAVVIVVATKELIMYLPNSILRLVTRQHSIGDYIEINGLRGWVVGINILNTLMMQIGPSPLISRLSGKALSFPNSLLLSRTVRRDSILGNYVIHTVEVPVPIHLDSDEIMGRLKDVFEPLCAAYVPAIQQYLENVQTQKLFITPAAQPRVLRVPYDDKVYHIIVRLTSPVSERLKIQQTVLDEFLRTQYRLINQTE